MRQKAASRGQTDRGIDDALKLCLPLLSNESDLGLCGSINERANNFPDRVEEEAGLVHPEHTQSEIGKQNNQLKHQDQLKPNHSTFCKPPRVRAPSMSCYEKLLQSSAGPRWKGHVSHNTACLPFRVMILHQVEHSM